MTIIFVLAAIGAVGVADVAVCRGRIGVSCAAVVGVQALRARLVSLKARF